MWCIGYCYRGSSNRNDANESYIEAQYNVPLQEMFVDINNHIFNEEITYEDTVHYYSRITAHIAEDCVTCDNSSELIKLRDFLNKTLNDLKGGLQKVSHALRFELL